LEQEFEQVESLKNYEIYRRSDSGKSDEDDDDKDKWLTVKLLAQALAVYRYLICHSGLRGLRESLAVLT